MSKRGAVEKHDSIPVAKKTCLEMATCSKKSFDTNSSGDSKMLRQPTNMSSASGDSKTLRQPTNMSSASPEVHHATTSASSAKNLEDSGIEVTPVVNKALSHIPKMPGFALNPPKSFSGPKYSGFASSDTGTRHPCSEASLQERSTLNMRREPAGVNNTVSHSPQSDVGQGGHGDGGGDGSAAFPDRHPLTSQQWENTQPPVCVGKPSGDRPEDKNKTTGTTTSGSVAKSVSHRVQDADRSETRGVAQSRVPHSSAKRSNNSRDSVKHKSSRSSIKDGEKHDGIHSPQHPKQTVTQAPPIPRPSKDKLKQHVTTAEHKTASPVPKPLKDKLKQQQVTTPERKTAPPVVKPSKDKQQQVTTPERKTAPPVVKPSKDKQQQVTTPERKTAPPVVKPSKDKQQQVTTPERKTAPPVVKPSKDKQQQVTTPERKTAPPVVKPSKDKQQQVTTPEHKTAPPVVKPSKDKQQQVTIPEHKTAPPVVKPSKDKQQQVTTPEHKTAPPVVKPSKDKQQQVTTPEHKTAPPVVKPSKDKQQQVTTPERKTAPPVVKPSKDKLKQQHVTTPEHKTCKSQTSKGRHQSAPATKGREAEENNVEQNQAHRAKQGENSVVQNQGHPAKPSSPHSQSRSRKRGSTPRNGDPKKLQGSSSIAEKKIVEETHQARSHNNASGASPEKKKKTVLPASLLKGIVKTVQENVGTISKQVVAAAVSVEPSVSAAVDSGYRKAEDSLAAETQCPASGTNNKPTVSGAASSDLSSDALTATAPTVSAGRDTVVSDDPSLLADNGQESETNLPSVLPGDGLAETEKPASGQLQQQKNKKKKKSRRRQRKSTEGECDSLLGVLPDYIPENDLRLKKEEEDKVYNLSALFSGQLLNNRPPPNRSRPNYFFAIQITNPEIQTGFSLVQQGVGKACPKLKAAFVSVQSAHLTLGVMHLPDEEAVTRVISVMEEFRVAHQQRRLQWRQGQKESHPPDVGEKTHPADVGEKTHPADVGEKTHPPDVGEKTHLPDVGEKTHPADVGEKTHLPDVGEKTHLPDVGEKTHLPDVGEKTHLPDVGEKTHLPDVGEKTHLPDVGEKTHPPDVGEKTHLPDVGEKTHPPDVGEKTHPPDVGEKTHPPDVGEKTHLPDVGEKTHPPDVGEKSDPADVGEKSDPFDEGKADPSDCKKSDPADVGEKSDPADVGEKSDPADVGEKSDPFDEGKADPSDCKKSDPADVGEKSDPADVGEKSDPFDEGKADPSDCKKSDPADVGEKSDPADVGEKSDPADVGEKSDPFDGEKADPSDCKKSDPADVGEKSDPADVGEKSDPFDGEKTDPSDRKKSDPADLGEKSDPADVGEKPIPGLMLEVKGLDTFNNSVVFAKVTEGAALNQVKAMAEFLRTRVIDQNITMDSKPFAPHITLMKMSKIPGNLKASGLRKIDGKLYQEFNDTHFGRNAVTSVQLCSMLKPKKNQYYHIEHEIPVSVD